jgi:hypothetical protein
MQGANLSTSQAVDFLKLQQAFMSDTENDFVSAMENAKKEATKNEGKFDTEVRTPHRKKQDEFRKKDKAEGDKLQVEADTIELEEVDVEIAMLKSDQAKVDAMIAQANLKKRKIKLAQGNRKRQAGVKEQESADEAFRAKERDLKKGNASLLKEANVSCLEGLQQTGKSTAHAMELS